MDMNIQQKILDAVLSKPENKTCADCDMKNPKWASTSFGIFICLRCSGMHRQLQVHITKVKSVTLDKWQPEVVEMYKHLNNSIANSYWEAKLPGSHAKLNIDSKPAEVESFIIDKYINKRWVDLSSQIGRNGLDPAKLYQQNRKEYDQYVRELFGHSNTQIHQNISPQSQNVLLNQRGNSNSSQIKRQMQEMAVSQDQPQDFNIQSLQQQVNQQSNQTTKTQSNNFFENLIDFDFPPSTQSQSTQNQKSNQVNTQNQHINLFDFQQNSSQQQPQKSPHPTYQAQMNSQYQHQLNFANKSEITQNNNMIQQQQQQPQQQQLQKQSQTFNNNLQMLGNFYNQNQNQAQPQTVTTNMNQIGSVQSQQNPIQYSHQPNSFNHPQANHSILTQET
eukprot:403344346